MRDHMGSATKATSSRQTDTLTFAEKTPGDHPIVEHLGGTGHYINFDGTRALKNIDYHSRTTRGYSQAR